MPELPEVETLKTYLGEYVVGKVIKGFEQRRPKLRYPLAANLDSIVLSSKITSVHRRAKYLIINLDNGYSLIIHLGMSGRFTLQPPSYQYRLHDHVIFLLVDSFSLVFNDPRRFGMIWHAKTAELEFQFFSKLGPEPLSDDFNADYLKRQLACCRAPVKTALMDSKVVVGVGNIYASESLFLAKISPEKPSCSLAANQLDNLVASVKQVLTSAILAGGTTLKDFVNGDSKPGFFKQKLLIYGRVGQSCSVCSQTIVKIKQSGRATFCCKNCQPN